MTTGTKAAKGPAAKKDKPASSHAVLFLLEGLAGVGRKATFDVLKSILGEQGLKFTPAHMSRFCLHSHPEVYLEDLLEDLNASRQSVDGLLEDLKGGIAMQLSAKSRSLSKGMAAVLDAIGRDGVALAALTALPESVAETLMGNLGLTERGVELVPMPPEAEDTSEFPRADSWLKLAKSLKKTPVRCAVLAGDMTDCKSALSAGMRCVVIPDDFTAFQDFSGADEVIDDLGEVDADGLVQILCPPEF